MFNETANKEYIETQFQIDKEYIETQFEIDKEYIETQFEIDKEIKKLQDKMAGHNEKAINLNWGHVGDVKYILAQLKQINEDE